MCDDDEDSADSDESLDEEAFREALGTRPPLPDKFQFNSSYRTVLEIFFAATHEDPKLRPSAKEILDMLNNKTGEDDKDDSIMCVNMVRGEIDLSDSVDDSSVLNDSSVICIDDSVDDTTPSAV